MCEIAEALQSVADKTIVLCGSMQPARMQETDAHFNIGAAFIAAQTQAHGVYIVMNGQIFAAGSVRKNRDLKRFERTNES
jgi:L-asparaginase